MRENHNLRSSERPVKIYQTVLCHVLEDDNSNPAIYAVYSHWTHIVLLYSA